MRNAVLRTVVLSLALLLIGCAGNNPVKIAERFWYALRDGDLEKARSYSTKETANSLTLNKDGEGEGGEIVFGEPTVDGEYTVIPTRIRSGSDKSEPMMELETHLVQEEGKWRVDVTRTMLSMFGDEMGKLMQGMSEAMGGAMQDLGKVMEEELEELGKKMEEEMKKLDSKNKGAKP